MLGLRYGLGLRTVRDFGELMRGVHHRAGRLARTHARARARAAHPLMRSAQIGRLGRVSRRGLGGSRCHAS
eukprot:COSAG01_NODE_1152_length_11492_cov_12.314842_12_plen_71_part_00